MRSRSAAWGAAVVLLITLPALGADRFVTPSGSDAGNDCTQSTAPCATIEHATLEADPGDTVKVTAGSVSEPVVLFASTTVTISGGWENGFGAQNSQRTKLREDFVVAAGTGDLIDVRLERMDFLGAQARISGTDGEVRMTLADCRVRRNTGWGLEVGVGGSAVVSIALDATELESNRFARQPITDAGGLLVRAGGTAAVAVDIARSTISANRSYYYGGAFEFGVSGDATVDVAMTDSEITRNAAGSVTPIIGAAAAGGHLTLDLRRVLISGNKRSNEGMLAVVSGSGGHVDVAMDACRFEKNHGEDGAGVRLVATSGGELNLDVRNSVFVRNTAKTYDVLEERGAAVYATGDGGAVHAALTNVTITRNRGSDGAVFLTSATGGSVDLVLRNSVVWGNQTGTDLSTLVEGGSVVVDLDHSDVGSQAHMGATVNDLGGNLTLDPRFVKPGTDVHLAADSPLIDGGTCTGAPPDDFDGDPRPTGPACDIGADEFVP